MDRIAKKDQSPSDSDITFKVQVLAASKPVNLDRPPYKEIEDIEARKNGEDSYRYLVGNFNRAEEAVNRRDKLRKEGFKGAFVVAYKNGDKIPFEEAISLTQN